MSESIFFVKTNISLYTFNPSPAILDATTEYIILSVACSGISYYCCACDYMDERTKKTILTLSKFFAGYCVWEEKGMSEIE